MCTQKKTNQDFATQFVNVDPPNFRAGARDNFIGEKMPKCLAIIFVCVRVRVTPGVELMARADNGLTTKK